MVNNLGFCVIYRARVHPDKEALYVSAWSKLTRLLRTERGALGSRLHKGNDGIWYAYAQWPSAEARRLAFLLPSVDPSAEQDVRDSISEYFPEIVLDPIEDQLVPITGLAPN
ncbi:antibiotic biosynthesis monooxygenase family protein [Solilutibacter silvestris]|uniref:antibiotic biosynthesis monooxygenase family protein n=1 Tax=Solilutibacter silvestris TaxID=1645665 RepID=UPI003D34A3BA